jgi:hypothetical protein
MNFKFIWFEIILLIIIFFFLINNHTGNTMENDKVLSLSKLKTLEYRIFRKLREKLRNFVDNSSKTVAG